MKTAEDLYIKHSHYSQHYKKDIMDKQDYYKALTEHDNEIKQLMDEMQSKIQNSLDEYLLEHRSETEGTLKIISECEREILEELKSGI